jgi:hypothetical protein
MAHNIQAAIADMRESIAGISWAGDVVLEEREKGSNNLVTITPAGMEEEFRFGEVKRDYQIEVKVYFAGLKEIDPSTVHQRCRDINNAILIDRKRGGNALTTITDAWGVEENEGRNSIVMVSEPIIQTLESC